MYMISRAAERSLLNVYLPKGLPPLFLAKVETFRLVTLWHVEWCFLRCCIVIGPVVSEIGGGAESAPTSLRNPDHSQGNMVKVTAKQSLHENT